MSLNNKNVAYIENIIFLNKQDIPWDEVKKAKKELIFLELP